MASSTPASEAVASSISKLTIDPSKKPASGKAQKMKPKKVVVESWEDEDVSSDDSEGEAGGDSRPSTSGHDAKAGTAAPPPTPVSPNYNTSSQPFTPMTAALSPTAAADGGGPQSRRPEKTDAVARRMIASALGVKVPKQTEEQKAYDRAMRENERKRREEDRAVDKKKQEEADEAKRAIWED